MNEDFTLYFDRTTGAATLSGVAVLGLFDLQGVELFGGEAITTEPTFLLQSTAVPANVVGATLVHGGVSYVVRTATAEPPDGALTRLSLARA